MKFAFLVHPLSEESKALMDIHQSRGPKERWGGDLLDFCKNLHLSIAAYHRSERPGAPPAVRDVDELAGLVSQTGAIAHGRLYEIPMDAGEILEDPSRAVQYMEQAVDLAAQWGAELVGLGSMTGIVGGQGSYLAQRGPLPVTTGNCLTVYAALQNLYNACRRMDVDLTRQTVAIVGVPGSIASAAATILAPQCGRLLLVGRRASPQARQLADQLGGELLLDIPAALRQASVVVSATSTGDCIDQHWLQPGSMVVDVAVPTDVQGNGPERSDVLILSGGLARVPRTSSLDSLFLMFNQGMVPSCLGETITLAMENRPECFSLGRNLSVDRVLEIGAIAREHGFDFSRLFSFGQPIGDSTIAQFSKSLVRIRQGVPLGFSSGAVCDSRNGATHVHPAESANGSGPAPHHVGTSANGSVPSNGHVCDALAMPRAVPTPTEVADLAQERYARYVNPVLVAAGRNSDFVKTFVRGEGPWLWDQHGRSYLDFVSGFGSVNLGHNHPRVARAIADTLQAQAPGFAQSAVNPLAALLAERLISHAPASVEMAFFCNSGAEAVEAAIKLARAAGSRRGILSCSGSFHGKSLGALSITGNSGYRRPFEPLVGETDTVPFGDLEVLERALSTRRFAAFVVEPVQAEGGMFVPPAGYLRQVQQLCRQTDTLLIVDEVQTGMGRTGSIFAVQQEGVEPDIIAVAKSLGGGLVPIGAMLARRDLWMRAYGTVQTFALHTSTFGGGSLACAAALATLDVLEDEGLCGNAVARGQQLVEGLQALAGQCPIVREVRGRGLLLGLELKPLPESIVAHWKSTDPSGMTPYLIPQLDEVLRSVPALYVMQALLHGHGIYAQVTRSRPSVLRVQPPLAITAEQVDTFLQAVAETCNEVDLHNRLTDTLIAKTGIGKHEREAAAGAVREVHVPVGAVRGGGDG